MVISQILTPLPETEDIAAPISHINPLRPRRNWSDLFDALFPDQRLAPPRVPLCPGFLFRGWFTDKGLLTYTPQELLVFGIDSKHTVHKEALGLVAAPDWTQTCGRLMCREIDVGRVPYHQDLPALCGLLVDCREMGSHDLLVADCLVPQKLIGRMRLGPVAHTCRQGDRRVFSQGRGQLDQPICASWISQFCRPECLHCPCFGILQRFSIHTIFSLADLCSSLF